MKFPLLGLAGGILAVSLITPANAVPRPSGITTPGLVQQVDRHCWWRHGHRHCRYEPDIVIDFDNHHRRHHEHHEDHHDNDHHDNDHHDHDDHHGDKH